MQSGDGKKTSSIIQNLTRKRSFRYALIWQGVLIGAATGLVISGFRLLLIYADSCRNKLVEFANRGFGQALLAALIMLVLALLVTFLLRKEPEATGSGIPQVEAELMGRKDMNWLRVLVTKILGCALSIGGGLALGREGPSIQIGAMVGKGFARSRHRVLTEERYLMSCGAGAGLSAAFGAPLAGTIFCLEELYHNFASEVLLSTMAAATTADFVTAYIIGLDPVFGFQINHSLPLRHYWAAVLLGIILGLFGCLYNRTIARMQDIFDRIAAWANGLVGRVMSGIGTSSLGLNGRGDGRENSRGLNGRQLDEKTGMMKHPWDVRTFAKVLVGMAICYVCFFVYPVTLGSGNNLVGEIAQGQFTLRALAILLVVKFVFSTASFGTTAPGGIFLPLLVLGALTGGVFSETLEALTGLDGKYVEAFVVLAMAGYFAAIVHAPVTGVVLITEMTGDFRTLLPMVLVSLIAYVVSERLGTEPIYTQLMKRASGSGEAARYRVASQRKTIIDDRIVPGCDMEGMRVMDLGLPIGALIISIIRDEEEFIPDGHTILRGNDILEILLREEDIADVEKLIQMRGKVVKL